MVINEEWVNYGDVNWLEYGGVFIKQDGDYECYYIVRVVNLQWAAGEKGFLVSDSYVDITDDWIEWASVLSYSGANSNTTSMDKAEMVHSYYGAYHLGGEEYKVDTEREAIQYLFIKGVISEEVAKEMLGA